MQDLVYNFAWFSSSFRVCEMWNVNVNEIESKTVSEYEGSGGFCEKIKQGKIFIPIGCV